MESGVKSNTSGMESNDKLSLKEHMNKEPIAQFSQWFEEATQNKEIPDAKAMALATSNKNAVPKVHMVFCKGFAKNGFEFYTSYTSPKAVDMEENPRVSLVFYWAPMRRCVYIQGIATKVPKEESDQYFQTRPRKAQINTLTNTGGRVRNRAEIVQKAEEITAQYQDECIPIPRTNWGGYLVIPHCIEFFQGKSDQIHDRLRYRKACAAETPDGEFLHQGEDGWVYERLAP